MISILYVLQYSLNGNGVSQPAQRVKGAKQRSFGYETGGGGRKDHARPPVRVSAPLPSVLWQWWIDGLKDIWPINKPCSTNPRDSLPE